MALVRIQNITKGKLVFLAVRDAGDYPLTLEAGEVKDIHSSMASQPSLQAVKGTKVLFLSDEAPKVEKPKAVVAPAPVLVAKPVSPPPVAVVEKPTTTTVVEDAPASVVAETVAPEEQRTKKSSKYRR